MRAATIALLRAYQLVISPYMPAACRFYPTCSQYAIDAVNEHGIARGSLLALARLARCHPFNPGGVDFVVPAHAHASRKGTRLRCTRSHT
ncbi:MAG: membrane protein insertion efficiency factor YidD [Candidatus Tumulicola sp.]